MLKAYKYRIYPNKEQETIINKNFGCCRFLYNYMLNFQKENYEAGNKYIGKFDMGAYMREKLYAEFEWLKEADSTALETTLANLDAAFQKFFKEEGGYPKFKTKKSEKKSYTTRKIGENIKADFQRNLLKVPKITPIKIDFHRKFKGEIKRVTISKTSTNKYFASIVVETEHNEIPHVPDNQVGITLGLENLAVLSDGTIYKRAKIFKKYEKKISLLNQELSRKEKDSKNREKIRIKLAQYHEKIENIRKDYLNKVSHEIVKKNEVIAIEKLEIQNMIQNSESKEKTKEITDASLYEFTRQLEYKSNWNNRIFVKIEPMVLDYRKCSECGEVNENNVFQESWECPHCGSINNRLFNSSKEILKEACEYLENPEKYKKKIGKTSDPTEKQKTKKKKKSEK